MTEDLRLVSGWGRAEHRMARVARPGPGDDLAETLHQLPGAITVRAAGRSYGDATLPRSAGGSVLDLTQRDAVLDFDRQSGVVVVQSGISLGALQALCMPYGWTVPVMPGTAAVTVGGAIASDVHGKNQPGAGTFGRHVRWLQLLCAEGGTRRLSYEQDRHGYWATVGGMGLTGVIDVVALELTPVSSGMMWHRRSRTRDLASTMWLLESAAGRQAVEPLQHCVAWIDASTEGRELGRGVVDTLRHAEWGDLPARRSLGSDQWSARPLREARSLPGSGVVTRRSIRLWGTARWELARQARESLVSARHGLTPMDAVPWWPAAFGREGLVQYQLVLPPAAAEGIRDILLLLQRHHVPPALAVLKRFTPGAQAPLAFAVEGWSLAMDFPRRWPQLESALTAVDELVAEHGGRVYLTKDTRLSPSTMARMYPQLPAWRDERERLDPSQRMTSALGARLGLVGSAQHTRA